MTQVAKPNVKTKPIVWPKKHVDMLNLRFFRNLLFFGIIYSKQNKAKKKHIGQSCMILRSYLPVCKKKTIGTVYRFEVLRIQKGDPKMLKKYAFVIQIGCVDPNYFAPPHHTKQEFPANLQQKTHLKTNMTLENPHVQ